MVPLIKRQCRRFRPRPIGFVATKSNPANRMRASNYIKLRAESEGT